jgi:cellulose synthase/poly-beta-1,6-N-acetylglucosamine synthase-like glycosyltransferase
VLTILVAVVSYFHCDGRDEDVVHLFLFCEFAAMVWRAVFRWLDLVILIPPDIFMLFDCLIGAAGNKKVRSRFSLIWHATIWMIWSSRNKVIFSNGVKNLEEVVEAIKLISWRWGLSRHKIPICLYYEWCWDPGLCLRR